MLEIKNLKIKLKNFLIEDISFNIKEKEYFVLLGPSGGGKSTLIKSIAGLIDIDNGLIVKKRIDISSYPPEKRNISYVPQEFKLFPNLNVLNNIIFGMKIKKFDKKKIKNKIEFLSQIFKIKNILYRKVDTLSGGEKQRVAIARALAIEPDVLLLDEPFSSLDIGNKKSLWFSIKKSIKETGITTVHITHDLEEASAIADRLGVLINGKILQVGSKEDIFDTPSDIKIATYLGYKNIFPGTVIEEKDNICVIKSQDFILKLKNKHNLQKGDNIVFCIKANDIKILNPNKPVKSELANNIFNIEIIETIFFTNFTTILGKIKKTKTILEITFPSYIYKRYDLYIGKNIEIAFWEPKIIVWK